MSLPWLTINTMVSLCQFFFLKDICLFVLKREGVQVQGWGGRGEAEGEIESEANSANCGAQSGA